MDGNNAIGNYFPFEKKISWDKRAIFQTFWKQYNCTILLFFELETSNFGYSYVVFSPLKWQGQILPNLTF
jgi:hypothetical protein